MSRKDEQAQLYQLLGHVRAARAALTPPGVSVDKFFDESNSTEFNERLAGLDEQLRGLARDIARRAGEIS